VVVVVVDEDDVVEVVVVDFGPCPGLEATVVVVVEEELVVELGAAGAPAGAGWPVVGVRVGLPTRGLPAPAVPPPGERVPPVAWSARPAASSVAASTPEPVRVACSLTTDGRGGVTSPRVGRPNVGRWSGPMRGSRANPTTRRPR
jgi:hypothetical protein